MKKLSCDFFAKGSVNGMKSTKIFPKTLLFFYLIPYCITLLFTALYCFGEVLYMRTLWMTEWMVGIPAYLSEYLMFIMVYALFGVCAYYIFFGKLWQKIAIPAISVVCAFFFPALRYLIRHIICGSYLDDLAMYDMYADDVAMGVLLASYCLIALLVILIECAYHAWILRDVPRDDRSAFSPRHPVGLTMLIFFVGIFVWAMIGYVLVGEYTLTSLLMLLLELAICTTGFFVATFAAGKISKWSKNSISK